MDRTLPRIAFLKIHSKGLLLHPRAGWGLIFWTMSFFNPKKFISRSFQRVVSQSPLLCIWQLSVLPMYSVVLELVQRDQSEHNFVNCVCYLHITRPWCCYNYTYNNNWKVVISRQKRCIMYLVTQQERTSCRSKPILRLFMSSFWVIFYTNSHDANITMKSHENHDFGVHTQWIKILFDGAVLFLFLLIHNYLFKSLWPFQNHPFSVDRCSVAELYLIFLSLMH